MYKTLKGLHDSGKLMAEGLSNAVIKGWITEKQKEDILAGK